jgi:hypothetical protein
MTQTQLSYFRDKPEIKFREYGRNVQSMVGLILEQDDKEKRTEMFKVLLEVMKRINPFLIIDTEESQQKIWDHLHIMSDFELDIDGKFPVPTPEELSVKPLKPSYSDYSIKNKQYGKNFSLLLKAAVSLEDAEDKEGAGIMLGKMIKNFYHTGSNRDNLDDAAIVNQIFELSNGVLKLDVNKVTENNLFDPSKDASKPALMPHERREANSGKKKKSKFFRKR